MKYYLLLVFTLLFTNAINAQSCLPDGIIFTSQAQIDSFPMNYPGCMVIEGDVIIQENIEGDIVSLDSLFTITQIEGDLSIGKDSFPVYDGNMSLFSLSGLENIVTIGGNLSVESNDSLTSLSELGQLTFINGDFIVRFNYDLPSFSGLNQLTSINGDFIVRSNIDSFSGLDQLTSINGDFIVGPNTGLTSFSGLDQLTFIGGSFFLEDNFNLTSFSGLDQLASIGGSLILYIMDNLINFSGLDQLTFIGGSFFLEENYALTSFSGLGELTSIGGDLNVFSNHSLTNFSGLDQLTSIGGALRVCCGNNSFASFNGLDQLTSIGEELFVSHNDSLTSLSSLNQLTSIGGPLTVQYNDSLTSLSGLNGLDYNTITELKLTENPNLSICGIQPICDYLENGGQAEIFGNAPGCNSESEIEDTCQVVSTEVMLSHSDAISIFPNPVNDILYFEGMPHEKWSMCVLNTMGAIVKSHIRFGNGYINMSDLPKGLYLLELQNDSFTVIKKVIKE